MSERGFALVTVVLLTVGLAVLATAFGFASAQQAAVRASLHDLARARYAAEGAARAAVDRWSAADRSLDAIGETTVLSAADLEPGVRVEMRATRLARASWLVHTRAVVARGSLPPLVRSARRLVRSLDIDSVGAALDAAVIAGRVDVGAGATVAGDSGGANTNALCSRWPAIGAALRAPAESTSIAQAADVRGSPLLHVDPDPARFRDRLGIFDRASLVESATPIAGERVSPAPAWIGTACDTATSSNWGAPAGTCANHYALVHAPGALTVEGGFGQGVLIASGDLVLDGDFVFRGLIIAAGSVVVRDAEVHGSIAARRVDIGPDARILLDRCALSSALSQAPPLARAVVPARSWLPVFD